MLIQQIPLRIAWTLFGWILAIKAYSFSTYHLQVHVQVSCDAGMTIYIVPISKSPLFNQPL